MSENILDTYKMILEYSHKIKAAIENKQWEQVNLLASKREDLIQETNAFVNKNKDMDQTLKKSIIELIKEINIIDDANFKQIKEDKIELKRLKSELARGQKALNAYQAVKDNSPGYLDQSL
jgi:predicted phage-related endonuclease